MGYCIYCGKPAGLLRQEHKECREAFEKEEQRKRDLIEKEERRKGDLIEKGNREMVHLVTSTIVQGKPLDSLEQQLHGIAEAHSINSPNIKEYLIKGWTEAVETALEDRVLTSEEETRLTAIKEKFSLSQDDLDRNGLYTKVVQAGVLRDILDGKIPERTRVEGNLPFNFQKTEQLVWVFQGVQYYEEKTRREFVGGSTGGSVRVAKGVYLRASSFKGHPVDRTETVHVDNGILAVTSKHIYFTGKAKSFRIPYAKIVSFKSCSDGIIVQRDAASAKPQQFITGFAHGWFTCNLITNLARR
jgi:hypothetical protein